MLAFELIASIATAVVAAAICILARQVPLSLAPHFWAGAGAFPFILGAIILLLSLVWVVDSAKTAARARAESGGEKVSRLEEIIGPPDRQRRLFFIAAATVVFVFLLVPLFGWLSQDYGFMGATFIFIFVNLKAFSRLRLGNVFLVSVVTAVSVYVIFTYGLMLPMPR